MQQNDQNPSSTDAPTIPEAAPISTYFAEGRFLPEKAVERLLSSPRSQYGEATLLMMGLMCWVIAPDEPRLLTWKLLDVASKRLEREGKRMSKMRGGKMLPGIDVNLMHFRKTKWLYGAFETLGGRTGLRQIPPADELRVLTARQARHAAYAGDAVCAVHRHLIHVSKEGRKYGGATVRKARRVVEQLLQSESSLLVGKQIDVPGKAVTKAETIRTEIWVPRRATLAWCYALNVILLDKMPLLVTFAERGTLPKGLANAPAKLANLAGIALFVQEEILPHLPADAKEPLPKFEYPKSLEAVWFSPSAYSKEELEMVLSVSIDKRWAGGNVNAGKEFHP